MNRKKLYIIIAAVLVVALALGTYALAQQRHLKEIRSDGIAKREQTSDTDDYRTKEKKVVKGIISDAKDKINKADSRDEVDKIISDAKKKVSDVKTAAQYKKEEAAEAAAKKKAAEKAAEEASRQQKTQNTQKQQNQNSSGGSSGGSQKNSGGCVNDDASNYY